MSLNERPVRQQAGHNEIQNVSLIFSLSTVAVAGRLWPIKLASAGNLQLAAPLQFILPYFIEKS